MIFVDGSGIAEMPQLCPKVFMLIQSAEVRWMGATHHSDEVMAIWLA